MTTNYPINSGIKFSFQQPRQAQQAQQAQQPQFLQTLFPPKTGDSAPLVQPIPKPMTAPVPGLPTTPLSRAVAETTSSPEFTAAQGLLALSKKFVDLRSPPTH